MLSPAILTAMGWAGNGCYFSRFALQWWKSERAKASVAPRSFWWLSLGGALLLGTYAFFKPDQPLFVGYVLTAVLYVRNLSIAYMGSRAGQLGPVPTMAVALALVALVIWNGAIGHKEEPLPLTWVVAGFLGQAVFSSRFVVQWYHSERRGRAHFPPVFWWLSLVGNTLLLAYAIRLGDPVFIAGFSLGPVVQVRNLMLADEPHPESNAKSNAGSNAGSNAKSNAGPTADPPDAVAGEAAAGAALAANPPQSPRTR